MKEGNQEEKLIQGFKMKNDFSSGFFAIL